MKRLVALPVESSSDNGWLEATEHYAYWQAVGLTHAEMLLALNITPPHYLELDTQLVLRAIVATWRQLQQPRRRAA
jgi:hypothetical protein